MGTCRLPEDMHGDPGEWLAAAVIAAGSTTYDGVLARGVIHTEDWEWGEAEALLVAGHEHSEDTDEAARREGDGRPVPPLDITVQWLASPPPPGVVLPAGVIDDFGDDPVWGAAPLHDPDWATARERLAADAEVLARRAALADVQLHLTARPVAEAATHRFESAIGRAVVLVLPVADFPESGSRVDAYISGTHRLLDAASR